MIRFYNLKPVLSQIWLQFYLISLISTVLWRECEQNASDKWFTYLALPLIYLEYMAQTSSSNRGRMLPLDASKIYQRIMNSTTKHLYPWWFFSKAVNNFFLFHYLFFIENSRTNPLLLSACKLQPLIYCFKPNVSISSAFAHEWIIYIPFWSESLKIYTLWSLHIAGRINCLFL